MTAAAVLRAIVTADTATASAKLAAFGEEIQATGAKTSGLGAISNSAFAAAGVAVAAFAAISIKAYMAQQKIISQLQNDIRNFPPLAHASLKAFEDQAMGLENLTARSHEEVLAADDVLTRFNLTQAQIEELVPHLADMAQRLGTDIPTAAETWGKAMEGSMKGLRILGIGLSKSEFQALSFDQQVQLLADHTRGAAKAFADSAASGPEKFQIALQDLEIEIGSKLTPALTQLAATLSSDVKIVTQLTGLIGGGGGGGGLNITDALGHMIPNVQVANGVLDLYHVFTDKSVSSSIDLANATTDERKALEAQYPQLKKQMDAYWASKDAADAQSQAQANAAQAADDAALAQGQAAAAAIDAAQKWEAGTVPKLNRVEGVLSTLAGTAKLTAHGILHAFDMQLVYMKRYETNWDTLLQRGLPQSLATQLQEMGSQGAGIVAALAHANKAKFDQIIADWEAAQGVAGDTAGAIDAIGAALDAIPSSKTISINTAFNGVKFAAEGWHGYTRQPTVFVTSEYGQQERVDIGGGGGTASGGGDGGHGHDLILNGILVGRALEQSYQEIAIRRGQRG